MRPNSRSTVIERLTLGHAVRRSAGLLAISQATADALVRHFPAAEGRTTVALLGVAPALVDELDRSEAATLPEPGFVLAVGTLEPRKNLPRLVAAYKVLGEELQSRHPLVVVGALGWETGETLDSLRSLGERARMLGYVSDAALAELYRRCAVFCYPSLGEGFGLPVLEAMAAGAVVLTSNVSSLPEVGGEAVAYADPMQVQEIAAQLQSLLGDESRRTEIGRAGPRARASEFSWARFAERTLAALERAARRQLSRRASATRSALPRRQPRPRRSAPSAAHRSRARTPRAAMRAWTRGPHGPRPRASAGSPARSLAGPAPEPPARPGGRRGCHRRPRPG